MPSVISATTTNGVAISPDNSGSLQLATNNGTTAVTIDTSQNVGIGTSSPSFKLDIVGSAARISNAGTANFATRNSTAGVNWEFGVDGSGNGFIYSGQSSALAFSTNASERMRITSGGDVLIAKTAADDTTVGFRYVPDGYLSLVRNSNPPLYLNRLSSDGRIQEFARSNTIVGNISVTTTATSYNTSSDYRLKENIAPMTGALGVVQQLKPVTYTWKADGSSGQGFIAHELQEVIPDCVTGEKDAVELIDVKDEEGNVIGQEEKPVYQGVDTSFLVATLTAAIQELKAELDTVKAELTTLKNPPVEGTE